MDDDKLFCLERLEDSVQRLNGSAITDEQSKRLTVDLVGCFIQFARNMYKEINNIKNNSAKRSSPKYWFVDRVLPGLIISLITWAFLGTMAWIALVNNHIVIAMP